MQPGKAPSALASLVFLPVIWAGCAAVPPPEGIVDPARLADGIYEGSYRSGVMKAVVQVTVKEHRISAVKLLRHWAWGGRKAGWIIPDRIIERQSVTVDAVSGATSSSHVIMRAVEDALAKAVLNR